jgi:hypothetical protein
MKKFIILLTTTALSSLQLLSQSAIETWAADTTKSDARFITVHFLYGSKPAKKYRAEESKWFGGVLGGHVGIEVDSNHILNFTPSGSFHVFSKKKAEERHSCYRFHDYNSFYAILGGHPDSMKQLRVRIPLNKEQSLVLDSIQKIYTAQTPYDYAFFGYRCGAAAYDILAKLGIMKKYGFKRTYRKIFYPKKLRRRLIRKAEKSGWQIERKQGTRRRIWEKD